MDKDELNEIIKLCGGIRNLAYILKLSYRTIQGWRLTGVPEDRVVFLRILKEAHKNG